MFALTLLRALIILAANVLLFAPILLPVVPPLLSPLALTLLLCSFHLCLPSLPPTLLALGLLPSFPRCIWIRLCLHLPVEARCPPTTHPELGLRPNVIILSLSPRRLCLLVVFVRNPIQNTCYYRMRCTAGQPAFCARFRTRSGMSSHGEGLYLVHAASKAAAHDKILMEVLLSLSAPPGGRQRSTQCSAAARTATARASRDAQAEAGRRRRLALFKELGWLP